MPENKRHPPEGLRPPAPCSLPMLRAAMESGAILEGTVERCDTAHDLHVSLGALTGVIPRAEAVSPRVSGAEREIAVLSRVGRPVCFRVQRISADEKGAPVVRLSRKAAQDAALDDLLDTLGPGSVVSAVVTHLEPFGAFLDIGRGIVALLPLERISVSRIAHPGDRFRVGQKILAAVWSMDREKCRFTMTHRELLGTWLENASRFAPGETVPGIVRAVRDYGTFIELAPNLAGLADCREGLSPGDAVSVYIKSIRPQGMKLKLQVISTLPPPEPGPLRYQITDGVLDRWVYSPPDSGRAVIETVFTPP